VEAVGIDRSRPILKVASERYRGSDLPLSFKYADFQKLPRAMTGRFDLVVCLANAISGVDTVGALNLTMRNFFRVLRPGGTLVIQALNFKVVKAGEIVPVKATVNNGIAYLRMMRRKGARLELTAIRLDLNQTPPGFEPFSHEFDNFTPDQLRAAASRARFRTIHAYADLKLTARYRKSGRDIVITARRPA
jgi:SAM-dependent methyltransferase